MAIFSVGSDRSCADLDAARSDCAIRDAEISGVYLDTVRTFVGVHPDVIDRHLDRCRPFGAFDGFDVETLDVVDPFGCREFPDANRLAIDLDRLELAPFYLAFE